MINKRKTFRKHIIKNVETFCSTSVQKENKYKLKSLIQTKPFINHLELK